MKKSTLLTVSAVMTLLPFTGNAQTGGIQQAGVKKVTQAASMLFNMKRNGSVKKTDIAGVRFLPQTVKLYAIDKDSGKEEYVCTDLNTYDQYGNTLSKRTLYGEGMSATTHVYTYDPVETSVLTSETEYVYPDQVSTTPSETRELSKMDVVRDSKGRLTEFTEYEADSDYGGLAVATKTIIEYGSDGKANKIVIYSYDEGEETKLTLKSISWEKYNGKLLKGFIGEAEYMLYDSENLIKSAFVEMSQGEYVIPGVVTTTYTGDTKREMTMSFSLYGMPVADLAFSYEKTDDNGSYTAIESMGYYGEESEVGGERVVYNENKDVVEDTELEGTTKDDMKISSSTKYEYGYNSEDLLPEYSVVSFYSTDTNEYSKAYKQEYGDYKDITDGIANTVVNGNEGAVSVYNAQGMYLGNSLDKASKGLNIIKVGEKNFKIMK